MPSQLASARRMGGATGVDFVARPERPFFGFVAVVVVVVFAAAWYYASAIKDQALVVAREQGGLHHTGN